MIIFKLVQSAILPLWAITVLAQGPAPDPGIAFLGAGYGSLPNYPHEFAPGQVVNLYFLAVPTPQRLWVAATDHWPEELGGYRVEFSRRGGPSILTNTGEEEMYRARIGKVTPANHCLTNNEATDRGPSRPSCIATILTVQLPFGLQPTSSSNSRPYRMTVHGPDFQSTPALAGVQPVTLHLLGEAEAATGPLTSEGLWTYHPGWVVHRRPFPGPYKPGDVITLRAWGLGKPNGPVEDGVPPTTPIPVDCCLVRVRFDAETRAPRSQRVDLALDREPRPPNEIVPEVEGFLVPGGVGLYEIRIRVPQPPVGAPTCDVKALGPTNMTIVVAGATRIIDGTWRQTFGLSDGLSVCVDTSGEAQ